LKKFCLLPPGKGPENGALAQASAGFGAQCAQKNRQAVRIAGPFFTLLFTKNCLAQAALHL